MADPTQLEPQKIDSTWPGSKIFDPEPSVIFTSSALLFSQSYAILEKAVLFFGQF